MNKTAINKMLDIITERKPSLRESFQYDYIKRMMDKPKGTLAYAEKLYVKENLRSLCVVAGLSYERLIMKVCK